MLVNSNSALGTLGTLRSQVNHKHTFVCLTSRKPYLLFVSREPGYCAWGQWLPCVLKNCVRMILSLLLQGETSHTTYHKRRRTLEMDIQDKDRIVTPAASSVSQDERGNRSHHSNECKSGCFLQTSRLKPIWVLKKLYFEINFTRALCGEEENKPEKTTLGQK